MAFVVVAQYRCEPADVEVVRDTLLKAREGTRAEPANLVYEVHSVVDQPGAFLLYESYVDKGGFEAHKVADHFRELIVETVWPLLVERVVTFAEVL
ncbi:putative quinol monooxygenase [Streptomyces sp. NPDC002680]|uniref:putative quinol monooxygenase n=1 Tax=Streptomyces sp. NPDC002680 TaxID=3364659 RepID=UPI0036A1846C